MPPRKKPPVEAPPPAQGGHGAPDAEHGAPNATHQSDHTRG